MLERDPRQLAAWAGAAIILALFAAWYFARSRPEAAAAQSSAAAALAVGTPAAAGTGTGAGTGNGNGNGNGTAGGGSGGGNADGSASQRVVVDVAGAVKHPGVYRLTSNDRVEDALRRAGGATSRADLSQLNRAAKLEDGRQILVPARARKASIAAPTAGTAGGGAPVPGTAGPPAAPIDLNTATLEQLDTLDGVGPSTAQKILDYRDEHGGFRSVDELDQVSGIGEKRLASLREHVRV